MPMEIFFVLVELLIVTVGVLGNTFVVYVIITDRKLLHRYRHSFASRDSFPLLLLMMNKKSF